MAKKRTAAAIGKDIYEGLLESLPDAIVVVDSDGIIQLANRQTEALFGYPRAELVGSPVEILVPDRGRFRRVIDLVLTDVVMQQMSGKELAERISAERPGIRVLFMSGYPQDVLERGVIAAGIPLLEKPFTADQLLKRVRAILDAEKPPAVGP